MLDRARRIAERAAQTRMSFLRMMSHELRTPLGAIRGFAELLEEEIRGLEAPPEATEFSATIRESATRALDLVSNLARPLKPRDGRSRSPRHPGRCPCCGRRGGCPSPARGRVSGAHIRVRSRHTVDHSAWRSSAARADHRPAHLQRHQVYTGWQRVRPASRVERPASSWR